MPPLPPTEPGLQARLQAVQSQLSRVRRRSKGAPESTALEPEADAEGDLGSALKAERARSQALEAACKLVTHQSAALIYIQSGYQVTRIRPILDRVSDKDQMRYLDRCSAQGCRARVLSLRCLCAEQRGTDGLVPCCEGRQRRNC